MTAGLLLLLALQGGGGSLDITAGVDRTRLRVGDEVTLTIRARSGSTQPVELILPLLSGFGLAASRDLTEVALSGTGGPVRVTVRELQLRVERAGTMVIGSIRARQGDRSAHTDPITLIVDSAASGAAGALGPLARRLLASAPPPARNDRVALTVIIPGDTALAGEQIDVIAAAWFPRDLRNRLRRLPIVSLETPTGVWAYPQPIPTEVVASRQVNGGWMDVFAVHAVLFPLAPGRLMIPPASVAYAVPVSSFFSREERFTLRTDSVPILVRSLPRAGRPTADQGVVAQDLTFALAVTAGGGEGRVGEPMEVTATLAGVGNVVLWPEPLFRWPPGFRQYPAQTAVRLTPRDTGAGGRPGRGLVSGSKSFRYMVVPDSAGNFVLPEVRYPYYDPAAGAYVTVSAAPRPLVIEPGVEPRAARALPPLAAAGGNVAAGAERLARGLIPLGWIAVLIIPPALAWLARRRPPAVTEGREEPAPRHRGGATRLGRLEREFLSVLTAHVPDPLARDGDGLAPALRAAGVESAVADHVRRLRDRLRAARYGPQGVGDAVELGAEIEQVLRVLGVEPLARRRRRLLVGVALLTCLAPASGQAGRQDRGPTAEALYEAGALRAAADSFAARAARHPRVAAHWYNLGATLYRAGADGKATAAWTVAARLAPRDPLIRRSRLLLPVPDVATERLLAVGVATVWEWALLAAAAWLALWLAVLTRRRALVIAGCAVLAGGAALGAGREWQRARRPLGVVVAPGTAVRVAPHGGASAAGTVEAGAALLVGSRYGHWLDVRRDGLRGWVLDTEVVRL